ncbi:MAG: EAL domain-containing protein [Chloroflexota bacterium]|nr:EAL domain-containing protein [Chloroflexota bacterium]
MQPKPETLLIVEDDPTIALLGRRSLQKAGYGVVIATSPEEALARVEQQSFVLVILDYGLQGVTGLELYQQLKGAGHDLPVILVTGRGDEATVIEALRAGVRDYLIKSDRYLQYLPEAVERVLAQVRTDRALQELQAQFQATFNQAAVGIAHIGINGEWLLVNQRFCDIVGRGREALENFTWKELTHPDDLDGDMQLAQRLLAGEIPQYDIEKRYIRDDRTIVWVHLYVSLVRDTSGAPRHFISVVEDITDRKMLEQQLAHQAFHDPLTGLPNRTLFLDRLEHALSHAARHRERLAVLFLDLDGFKIVNDSLGHRTGDRLLVLVAERLQDCLRAEDTVARLGGDEFTVLLEGLHTAEDAALVANRITEALRAPFCLGEREVYVSGSIGIILSDRSDTAQDLLRDADIAMYRAKHAGKGRYELFDKSMTATAQQRFDLEGDLRRAVQREEFELYYQPSVRIATGEVVGVEALLRWRHPARGLLGPAEFITVAEETGLILEIGRWVLEAACRQAVSWGFAELGLVMSVNLSARQFLYPGLVADVAQILSETGLPARCLSLEITESTAMDDAETTLSTLSSLKSLGVSLAIDDFGTGYSSLGYLRRFPIDVLKIDRLFVKGLGHAPEDAAIVETVLTLARALNMHVVAEGAETSDQRDQLWELGCEFGQGYHFAKPLSGEETAKLLQRSGLRVSPSQRAPGYARSA